MPTYEDPTADAAEAAEAIRGVGHALGKSGNARHAFKTLGELLALTRRLTEVTQRLGAQIDRDRLLAADDNRDYAAGGDAARAAAVALSDASTQIDRAEGFLDTALQHVSRIAWQTEPAVQAASVRFVNIVFLQGEDADRVLATIHRNGPEAGVHELAGFDYGDETVEAALENGYVYDSPPVAALDLTFEHDAYTMVCNPFMSHVALYRRQDVLPDPVLMGLESSPRHSVVAEAPSDTLEAASQISTQRVEEAEQRRNRLASPQIRRTPASHATQRGLSR